MKIPGRSNGRGASSIPGPAYPRITGVATASGRGHSRRHAARQACPELPQHALHDALGLRQPKRRQKGEKDEQRRGRARAHGAQLREARGHARRDAREGGDEATQRLKGQGGMLIVNHGEYRPV